jgi:glucose/arabinose dehydrogenase
MMRRVVPVVALAVLLLPLPGAGQGLAASGANIAARKIKGGLENPAAFTFAPDGRIFYGERLTGQIRIFDPSDDSDKLFYTVTKLATSGEQGLLGLALHPDYPAENWVYAYATRYVNGVPRNRILRIDDVGGDGENMAVIWKGKHVAASIHNGGHIAFGPDGMLYAVVGDAANPSNSQDITNNSAGKMLRMTDAGEIPGDNPFENRIWAYGIRNSFGFAFDPLTGYLWETENGPECNDELNFIEKAENYGWGADATCSQPPPPPENTNQDGPTPELPIKWWADTIAPVGAAFCVGCSLDDSEGTLFYGAYNTKEIRRSYLTANRRDVDSQGVVYTHQGKPLSFEVGPDNEIYFSTTTTIWKLYSP